MTLRRALPAGILDAGLSSASTFAAGLLAATILEPASLGAFALFFSAFLLAAAVPTQLLLVPAEVEVLDVEAEARIGLLRHSVRAAAPLAAGTGVVAAAVVAGLTSGAAPDAVRGLALTSALCAAVSPLQDHVRRCLHLAGRSWAAAATSATHVAGFAVAALAWTAAPAPWRPLGALATANIVSLAASTRWLRTPAEQAVEPTSSRRAAADPRVPGPLDLRALVRSGRWLLVLGVAPAATNLVAGSIVGTLAGYAALGYAEAARVVANPLFVLAAGVSAVVGPRAMEAGRRGDRAAARRTTVPFVALLAGAGVLYGLLTAPWPRSPLPSLLPTAYEVPGLLAWTVVATVLMALATPARSVLLGAGGAVRLALVTVVVSIVEICGAFTAGLVGALARPFGAAGHGVVQLGLLARASSVLAAAPPAVASYDEDGPEASLKV